MTEEERKAAARERARKWRSDNRERHRAYASAWAQAHPEHVRGRLRKWYEENTEQHRANGRRWRNENRERYREHARSDQRRRSVGRTPESIAYAEILRADPCSYCGEQGGVIEHIDSLKAGGTNQWTNLTGSCARCNARKRTNPLLRFLLRLH